LPKIIKSVGSLEELLDNWRENFNFMPLVERRRWRPVLGDMLQQSEVDSGAYTAALAVLAKIDLFTMATFILGYHDPTPQTYRSICDFIEDPLLSRKILIMPRGTLKTTLATKAESVRLIVNDPDIRIFLGANTAENAQGMLAEVQTHFEQNQRLQKLFHYCVPSSAQRKKLAWNREKMEVIHEGIHSEATVEAVGAGGTATSRHFNILLIDDPISEKERYSRAEMERALEWRKTLPGLLVPPVGEYVYRWKRLVSTRWSYYDYVSEEIVSDPSYMDSADPTAGVLEFPIMDTDKPSPIDPDLGTPLFPELYNEAGIRELKVLYGNMFDTLCMNRPLPSETAKFTEDQIRYKRAMDIPWEDMTICTLVDPSYGENEDNCMQAVVTVGWDSENLIYVLHATLRVMPVHSDDGRPSLIESMYNHWRIWKDKAKRYHGVYVEAYSLQKTIKYTARLEAMRRGEAIPWRELPQITTKSKEARISGLEGPFALGMVYFLDGGVGLGELIQQLVGYGAHRYKDGPDCLAWVTEVMNVKGKRVVNPEPSIFVEDPSNPGHYVVDAGVLFKQRREKARKKRFNRYVGFEEQKRRDVAVRANIRGRL